MPETLSPASLRRQLIRECAAMANHALGEGHNLSERVIETLSAIGQDDDEQAVGLPQLSQIHRRLAMIVAPAKPRTILLLHDERANAGRLAFLGPVPLVRRMMVTVVFLVASFIALATTPYVNLGDQEIGQLTGLDALVPLLFWTCAAALGAAFAALRNAHSFIKQGTFDPVYESSYWVRFVLGIVSGLALSALAPLSVELSAQHVHRPLVAFVGGFSVSVVYRIMTRITEAIESIFRGGAEAATKQQQEMVQRVSEEVIQDRLDVVTQLMDLKQELDDFHEDDVRGLSKKLDDILRDLTPSRVQ